MPELDKLTQEEQTEFLKLERIAPHEYTPAQGARMKQLMSNIDYSQLVHERQVEKAAKIQRVTCNLKGKDPYMIEFGFGVLRIPDDLVPVQFKKEIKRKYYNRVFWVEVAADLQRRLVTSLRFKEYIRKKPSRETRAWLEEKLKECK